MRRVFLLLLVATLVASCDMSGVRRLLLVAGGGASFPAPFQPFELSAAPSGGWSWFGDPRAVHADGVTFYGYVTGNDGDVAVRSYDHATETVSAETTLHAALEIDDHDNPGLLVRPDGKILAFYSAHLGAALYKRVSSSAGSIAAFDAEVNLDSDFGGTEYTYPSPLLTTQADGVTEDKVWLFFRNHIAGVPGWDYNASTDGGETWDGRTRLHTVTYSKIATNGDRIDMIASDHPGAGATKIYHLYREDSAWRQSDGTSMGAGIPFDGTDMTTVYDGGAKLVWVWDVAYGGDGHPRVTFVVFESDTDHRAYYGRWTGSAWETNEIDALGSTIATDLGFNADQVYYSGGVVLDHGNPNIVWASVGVGGGVWELRRYVTVDGGATWSHTVIRATGKNIRPSAVRGSAAELRAIWMTGEPYDSYVDYSSATLGVGD